MKNRPPYALSSVDNALLLLQMLRDHGEVRVSDAADELVIARSTAHRLLSMLVFRDFALQDDRRVYVPGPALAASQVLGGQNRELRRAVHPHMDALRERVQETVNLAVRVGQQVRFLASAESSRVLHVGDRQGTILPAHRTSVGKALLAELDGEQLEQLYRAAPDGAATPSRAERAALRRTLRTVRDRGCALNTGETEAGVAALGMCVRNGSGEAVGALSVSVPTARFGADRIPHLERECRAALARAHPDVVAALG